MILQATKRKKEDNLEQARQEGLIPAILYGEGLKNVSLFVKEKPFLTIFDEIGETSTLDLDIEGKKHQALIRETSKDPLTGKVIHLDFFHPSLKKKIVAEVPLIFKGESPAVKDLGGILEKELTLLNVKGLVKDLPHKIEVDLSTLKNLGDKIVLGDLNIKSEIEVQHNSKEDIVVHIAEPRKEEEPEPLEETPIETVEGEENKTEETSEKNKEK